MSTTIKVTKIETYRFNTSVSLDILTDDKIVGSATLIRYYDEDFRGEGFGFGVYEFR